MGYINDDDDSEAVSLPVDADAQDSPAPAAPVGGMNPSVQAYMAKLKAAQQQARDNQTGTGISMALAQLTHGLSRAPGSADISGIQAMAKNDNAPVDNFNAQQSGVSQAIKQKKDVDASDPDSDASQSFRNSLKLVAPKIADAYGDSFDQITAADAPNIMKTVDLKATIDSRNQVAGQRADATRAVREATAQSKSQHDDEKLTKDDEAAQGKIGTALNALTASGRNALGTAGKAQVSLKRLRDILSDKNATNQDMAAASADMNAVVSGSTTVAGSDHQEYNTLANTVAGMWQKITSNPTAPDIPEIKAHMLQLTDRMAKISNDVIDKNTRMVKASHSGWIKRHPEEWADMVSAANDSPGPAPAGDMSGAMPNATPSGLTPEQQKRLAVLRAKAAQ